MAFPIYNKGKILFANGLPAMSKRCCCLCCCARGTSKMLTLKLWDNWMLRKRDAEADPCCLTYTRITGYKYTLYSGGTPQQQWIGADDLGNGIKVDSNCCCYYGIYRVYNWNGSEWIFDSIQVDAGYIGIAFEWGICYTQFGWHDGNDASYDNGTPGTVVDYGSSFLAAGQCSGSVAGTYYYNPGQYADVEFTITSIPGTGL